MLLISWGFSLLLKFKILLHYVLLSVFFGFLQPIQSLITNCPATRGVIMINFASLFLKVTKIVNTRAEGIVGNG